MIEPELSFKLVVLVFLLPAWFLSAIPRPRPPRRLCGECGGEYYGWGMFCSRPECVAARTAPQETWRGFRKRVIEGGDQ